MEVAPVHSPLGPSWSAVSRQETLQGVTTATGGLLLPVAAERGSLTLSVQSGQLAGGIRAVGLSTLGQSSSYEAQFTGTEQEKPVSVPL